VRRRLGGVAALCLALSACGISTTGGARAISHAQLPKGPQVVPTTAPSVCRPGCATVTIVFLDSTNNLAPVAVQRLLPPQSDQLSTIVRALLSGPAQAEQLRGLTSQIPTSTELLNTPNPLKGSNQVTVDLSRDFIAGNSLLQEQEVEQVVYTIACAVTPTTGVQFEVEGNPQPVPIASGTTVNGPVSAAADYGFGAFNCTPTS